MSNIKTSFPIILILTWLITGCATPPASSVHESKGIEKTRDKKTESLFDDTQLHQVEITMDDDVYERMLREHFPNGPAPDYRLIKGFVFDGKEILNAGMRGRGNSFNQNNRRSFKVKFDCVDPLNTGASQSQNQRADLPDFKNRKFQGVSALNLRCSNNDPSLIREILAYKLFRQFGVPAPRGSLALLKINGRPMGVYGIIEEEGSRSYLKQWFEDPKGNFYKGSWDANVGASFSRDSYNPTRYTKQSGPKDDSSDMKALLKSLSEVKSSQDLEALFDKQNLLYYNAISALVGHWDSFNGNMANDYIYHNPQNGKWYVSVWDTDNSFGSDWLMDCREAPLDILAQNTESTTVFCRLAREYWAQDYRAVLSRVLDTLGSGEHFAAWVYELRDMIKTAVEQEDPYLEDFDAFWESYDTKPTSAPFRGGDISQYRAGVGLTKFFKDRLAYLRAKL